MMENLSTEPSNDEAKEEWQVCCSRSNKEFVKYISQVGLALTVIIFSSVAILDEDRSDRDFWSGLLFGTLGLMMPHPTMK